MASFDPIEYFGVGHGRDIAVVRQARTPSQTSISLSDGEPATQEYNPGWTQHAAPPLRGIAKEPPWPPLPSFGHITPENSVSGRVNPPSPAASPNVSSHGCMSDPAHPHILGRYVHDAERHEQIAMSFHYPPGTDGYPEPVASYSTNPPPPQHYSHFGTEQQQYPNSDAPMNRYLTDLLAYEQLAMALRAQQEGYNPHDNLELYEYTAPEGFALSISNGPDFDEEEYYEERAEEEEGPAIEQIKLNGRHRREQATPSVQPRLFKMQLSRSRKRHAEASQPLGGHKDKMAKRC